MLLYNKSLKQLSRSLRRNMTDAETLLWSKLRGKQLRGFQFYRQKIIDNYIADFYFYQGGLDTSFDEGLTPGYLLHSQCIENAIQKGVSEYHFLLMGNLDAYKKQWAGSSKHMCDIYMARPGIMKMFMKTKTKARNYYHCVNKLISCIK